MKPATWWTPGLTDGLISRSWAQVYVFPLPSLKRSELEVSLRFKVQALLPSPDLPLATRFFRHKGGLYGLVLIDRLPVPRPPEKDLAIGMPLILPAKWPQACLLAVFTPEGWEVHSYDNGVLSGSYPPFHGDSPMVAKIRGQHPDEPVFWVAPDADLTPQPPAWAEAAPEWPSSRPWGIPWNAPPESRWPWFLGGLLLLVGLAALGFSALTTLTTKQDRNHRWESWLQTARAHAGAPALSAQKAAVAQNASGVPLEDVLASLAHAWPSGVEIRFIELGGSQVAVTARASSALTAVSRLSREALWRQIRVVQIRPLPGGEEFDLEGSLSHDQ